MPPARYIGADRVVEEMARFGSARVELDALRVLVLAILAGAFITAGALFSAILGSGVDALGPRRLLEGFGFSAGFFFVILSQTVLFTDANVVLPTAVLEARRASLRLGRFWAIAWVGNLAGAVAIGWAVHAAQVLPEAVTQTLGELVDAKLEYRERGAWGEIVLSGVLANWLVGMAAFFAVMGRTIIGKYLPVFAAVTLFVSANFQHSPANMGYFALVMPGGDGPGWATAMAWNVVPAGIGNVIGGALLVSLPFWFVYGHRR